MFRLANRSVLNVYFGHGAFLCAYVGAYFYGPFVGFLYRLALKNGGREAAGERVSGAHSVGHVYLWGLYKALLLGREDVTAVDSAGQNEHFKIDRKSTRLNSSHANISYAVFCLKKKNT